MSPSVNEENNKNALTRSVNCAFRLLHYLHIIILSYGVKEVEREERKYMENEGNRQGKRKTGMKTKMERREREGRARVVGERQEGIK